MKRWYYISLFLFFAAVRLEAQDTIRITLTEAVELGISRSVDVMVAKNEYISAYWDYRTYKTELLPEVTFKGTAPLLFELFVHVPERGRQLRLREQQLL